MFIGHLPSSLVAFNALPDSWKTKRNFYLGLLGSIFPDIDLIWLYGIAQHKEHHHNYPTHIPFFWFVTGLFALFCCDKKSSRISWL
ncbi:hypothetical protein K1X76_02325, partial [bacterium]|nr:hypothetical protein [bacterium]